MNEENKKEEFETRSIIDAAIKKYYDLLNHKNQTEIRLIDPHRKKPPKSFFVNNFEDFLKICKEYNGKYNVYAGLNERKAHGTTRDEVISVKNIVIDIDAVRPKKNEAATEEELQNVKKLVDQIIKDGCNAGFKKPIVVMTGNGYQLWYSIPEIKITDENRLEIESQIQEFHSKFQKKYSGELGKIDKIGDLARVVKVVGTKSIKGSNTKERPHRYAIFVDKDINRDEDQNLRDEILSLSPKKKKAIKYIEPSPKTKKKIKKILNEDKKIKELYEGKIDGYLSRSEAELALLIKLIEYEIPKHQCFEIMASSKIGKWNEAHEQYKELTYNKAIEFIQEKENPVAENTAIELNKDEMEEYKRFKENPNKLEEVWKILDELIVGEDENKKVIFLALLSAKLENPNGVRVLGDSSSGKTHLVRETLRLFPENMKIILGGQSKKSLIYRKPDYVTPKWENVIDLTNKILWFLEEKGGEESYEILRPILSRDQNEIRYEFVDKSSKTGKNFTKTVIVKGCPAFITTSTRMQILEEMGTRVFSLTPDMRSEQTEKIIAKKKENLKFLKEKPNTKIIQYYIQNLKTYDVWIPYVDLIQIGCTHLRARRDFDKIITLIKTYCLFHQYEKPKIDIKGKEYIVSCIEDYIYIIDLINPVLRSTITNVPKPIIDFYDAIRKKWENGDFDEIEIIEENGKVIENVTKCMTHSKIAEVTEYSQDTARKYCHELLKAGFLIKQKIKNANYYSFKENKAKEVLLSVITPQSIEHLIKELLEWLNESVIKNGVLILEKILKNYVFNFFSQKNHTIDFNSIKPESSKSDVITLQSHLSHSPQEMEVEDMEIRVCKRKRRISTYRIC